MSNDRSYLASLQDYYARHRALPSYASIGGLLGLRSKSSVAAQAARLKLGRFLDSTPDRRLAPTRRFFERPLADSPVHAGLPNPIDDAPADVLTLDDYLIERPSQTVLVRVKGDSMQDAGILDGDLAVVEKRTTARRGDIVVAIVDNQFTLKRLVLERGSFILRGDIVVAMFDTLSAFKRLDLERGRLILRTEPKAYPVIRPEGALEIESLQG